MASCSSWLQSSENTVTYVDGELQQLVTVVREHGLLTSMASCSSWLQSSENTVTYVDGELQQLVTVVREHGRLRVVEAVGVGRRLVHLYRPVTGKQRQYRRYNRYMLFNDGSDTKS